MAEVGEFALLSTVLVDGGPLFGVSVVGFDEYEDLLWAGNQNGHLTSYHGYFLSKYTSFQVLENQPLRALLFNDDAVVVLGKSALNVVTLLLEQMNDRYSFAENVDMQCCVKSLFFENVIVLGGLQSSVSMFSITSREEFLCVELREGDCTVMKNADHYIITGHSNGKVCLRNPWDFSCLSELQAHTGSLSDIAVFGTKLVTCGYSLKGEDMFCDRFVNLYDIRTMKPIAPIHLRIDPAFVRFISVDGCSRLLIVSYTHTFQIIDLSGVGRPQTAALDIQSGSPILTIDVSSNGQCFAFGDEIGTLHVFSNRDQPVFVDNPRPLVLADIAEVLPPISLDDYETPLSLVPVPITDLPLLSSWPVECCRRVYRKPLPIMQEVMDNLKMTDFVGHAPNPLPNGRPYFPYQLTDNIDHLAGAQMRAHSKGLCHHEEIPSHYQKRLIHQKVMLGKYTDMAQRRTVTVAMPSLEATVPNSYVNSVLLMLYNVEPLRKRILSHLCKRVVCLTCELSFLFYMFERAPPDFTQTANNFIRAFRTIPEASALGLVLNDREENAASDVDHADLIQNFNRFIIHHLNVEMKDRDQVVVAFEAQRMDSGESAGRNPPASSTNTKGTLLNCYSPSQDAGECAPSEEDLFAATWEVHTRCRCGHTSCRQDVSFVCSLSYPKSCDGQWKDRMPFEDLLERSFDVEQQKHAWCDQCGKYQASVHRRRVRSLPEVWSINCAIRTEEVRSFWRKQEELFLENVQSPDCSKSEDAAHSEVPLKREQFIKQLSWLPMTLCIELDNESHVSALSGDEDPLPPCRHGVTRKVYQLCTVVSCIRDKRMGHLVACIRSSRAEKKRWYLINDTQVKEVSPMEAVRVDTDWKVPCILLYARSQLNDLYPVKETCPIDDRVFSMDSMIVERCKSSPIIPSRPVWLPGKGDIVAIDAEFVTLNHEEAEIRSDGCKLTFKPSQLSLARITCVYGSGPLKGNTLYDDYICTREEISDYLTKFSGIKPGDLDPMFTEKALIPMKAAYLKLRYLVDNGVIFVGHGLSSDFNVINIYVPPEQVIDTVQLFRLPRRRLVSLRFLVWHFFGVRIQSGMHDSDEDARSALMLYHKYLEITRDERVDLAAILNEMYDRGQALQWQVPAP